MSSLFQAILLPRSLFLLAGKHKPRLLRTNSITHFPLYSQYTAVLPPDKDSYSMLSLLRAGGIPSYVGVPHKHVSSMRTGTVCMSGTWPWAGGVTIEPIDTDLQ